MQNVCLFLRSGLDALMSLGGSIILNLVLQWWTVIHCRDRNSCSKLTCMQHNPAYDIVFLSGEVLYSIYMVAQQVSDMSSLNFQLSKEYERMTWLEKFHQGLLLLTDLKLLAVKFHDLVLNMQLPSWNIYFCLLSVMFICTGSGFVSSSSFLLHPYYSSDWIFEFHWRTFLWFCSALRRIMT